MKDARGHGSNARPIPGSPYHKKSDAELRYIIKDASEAARASRGMSSYNPHSGAREDSEGKYLDQVNDASTVLGYRDRGGQSDHPDAVAARALASGPKSAPVPLHEASAQFHAHLDDERYAGMGPDPTHWAKGKGSRKARSTLAIPNKF